MNPLRISQPRGFQRATAEAALKILTRKDGPRRFLIADEVGLGKTVVARTIIGEMMKSRRRPLVVFYVSSNLSIAHQNRTKLLEILESDADRKNASAPADRLTLAGNPANRPTSERLHLYTLTPDTSVPMYRRRGGFGRLEERALIFRLLRGRFPSLNATFFSERCRGKQASENSWTWAVHRNENIPQVRNLQDGFIEELSKDEHFRGLGVNAESLTAFVQAQRPAKMMSSFRTALALAVLRDIQPDLVIFDEFQKFREMLMNAPGQSPDPVTSALRGGGRSRAHGVLLLSATPYRLYSTREDEAGGLSHHQDFFTLIRFLFGDESNEPSLIEADLLRFGTMMLGRETPDLASLRDLRNDIEMRLLPVLSRTERPVDIDLATNQHLLHPRSEIKPEDLRVFKHWVGRLREGEKSHRSKADIMSFAVPYWLSVPLPIQMLGQGYLAWRQAEKTKRRREEPVLRRVQRDTLRIPKVWPHPQFRALNEVVSSKRLSLPWVAPSLPWWTLQGPWSEPDVQTGKLLIFSRFKAVPPALASLLSYGLEASFGSRLRNNYARIGDARPLQFKENRPTLPALFFPSPTLIAFTDPRKDKPKSLSQTRNSMRRQVGQLLRRILKVEVRKSGSNRPLWKLLPALENRRTGYVSDLRLPSWKAVRLDLRDTASAQDEAMTKVLEQWDKSAQECLQYVTQSEVATLAEFALSGPGVVLGRALYRVDDKCMTGQRYAELLSASWNGLRQYLSRSIFQVALTKRNQKYTKAIQEAVVAGNLESVLDEHLWIASKLDPEAIRRFPQDLLKTLGLHGGRHRLHEPGDGDEGFLLRCHAAMQFADTKVESTNGIGGDRLRTDDLRRSFNTPFWPHVLVTTSLGQEGLDFHVWCRQLLHWDLCSSPLDLEQREGRIQRFGGLSVRTALAEASGEKSLESAGRVSPWAVLADSAELKFSGDRSGRSPWWSCPGQKIDRIFVVLPQSRQAARFDQLSRQRWLYRLALGQPHQQDFIERVAQLPEDGRQVFALRLSAWRDE